MPAVVRPSRSQPTHLLPRLILGLLAACVVLAAAGYVWLRFMRDRAEPLARAELTTEARQQSALATYAARAALGSFLPPADAVIGIREAFLQNVLDRSLPWRQSFDEGRYVVRLDHVRVRLESGVALVTLAGRGMTAGVDEQRAAHVDLIVRGHIAIVSVDPDSGTLTAGLVVTDVTEPGTRKEDVQNLLNPVARFFARQRAGDWNRQRRRIEIPVRVEHELVLPAVDGKVTLPETRVPLAVQVSAVTTLDHRLAVSLALQSDSTSGEPPIDAPDPRWNEPPPGSREVRLSPDSVRARVGRMAADDPLWRSVTATDHDLVLLVPESMLRTLVSRVAHSYLHGVEVDVQPKKVVHFKKRLRASILGKSHRVAHFEGEIRFGRMHGLLTLAGRPRVRLVPPDGLAIEMPARVVRGRGSVSVDVRWAPAKLLGLLCPPFRIQQSVSGDILPFSDTLRTEIHYAIHDSTVVGRPRVRRDMLKVPIALSDSSWVHVRALLEQEDKPGRCGLLMDADDALAHLRELVADGLDVRVPAHLFKPFHLPVLLQERYTSGDWRIEAHTYDPSIEVRSGHLRIAFRAALRVAESDTTRTPPADTARVAAGGAVRSARLRLSRGTGS